MSKLKTFRLLAGIALCGSALWGGSTHAATPQRDTKITVDTNGLQSLKAGAVEFLKDGQLRVSRVLLREWDGAERDGDLTWRARKMDADRKTLTQTYNWGMICCAYAAREDRVVLTMDVRNTSSSILQGLSFSPGTLHLPSGAKGLSDAGEMLPSVDAPGVTTQDWGNGTLAFCNEEVGRPLYVGLLPAGDPKSLALQVATFREDRFPRG